MSTTAEKVAKHIQWELDQPPQPPGRQWAPTIDVKHLTALVATQSRREPRHVGPEVKAELERLTAAGQLRPWWDGRYPSSRPDRDDLYVILRPDTTPGP